jgi:hypothetical protein
VKSFVGPQSRQHAEELAAEVRETHKAAAYLYEWGGHERRKELDKQQRIRQALAEREAPFLELRKQMRLKAEAEGREFDDTPPTIRVPKVEYQEQWAVMVGGFKDMDAARKALDTVRRWPAHLLDRAAVAGPGQTEGQAAFINPYATAMVFPNPTVRRSNPDQPPPVDPGLKRWNEKEELSLLKCPKKYTLLVKSFSVPTRTVTKDSEPGMLGQLFGGSKSGELLQATAQQAHTLADSLRSPKMAESLRLMGLPAVPFESYVLHVKTGSLVTVGGFESEDDPELVRTLQVLRAMTFQVADERQRPTGGVQKMFDNVYPIPIPKVQ